MNGRLELLSKFKRTSRGGMASIVMRTVEQVSYFGSIQSISNLFLVVPHVPLVRVQQFLIKLPWRHRSPNLAGPQVVTHRILACIQSEHPGYAHDHWAGKQLDHEQENSWLVP
mmetsp:Transcript_20908/g.51234  ORF Transcript_20908/g.51234 Transcript_20908/m.51234 type:complete len:113 (+) Transcript_20908:164-502(+)